MFDSLTTGIARLAAVGLFFVGIGAAAVSGKAMADDEIKITKVAPTLFFPKVKGGEPPRQLARLGIANGGPAAEMKVKVSMRGAPAYEKPLGRVEAGDSVKDIHIPDVGQPAELTIELYRQDEPRPVDSRTIPWRPQKKWNVYCISYSHHDLGYGDYPHRLRTTIRHANIDRPLQFCRETDQWDDDSKFRFIIETSEPLTSFLGSRTEAQAAELAQRVHEGRIQIGALFCTANTEHLSHECLARLFYLTNRHGRDLLGTPASRAAQIDDVVGLTWPLATFCAEANVPYLFHGYNQSGRCLMPAADEAVFYWRGPDSQNKILVRSTGYGGYSGDSIGDGSEQHIEAAIEKFAGPTWPYDVMLLQEGTDFQLVTRDTADKIHAWNAKWAYPRLVCATAAMFFDAVLAQTDPTEIKSFAKDGNNYWADQDANDAWLLGLARRQGEAIPTAEKYATIAQVLAGGGYPWTDVYQAYHRMLEYHEHTNAINYINPDRQRMQQYETELEENREMVVEAKEFCDRVRQGAFSRLTGLITTETDRNLIVFNPLAQLRTDVVRLAAEELPRPFRLVDVSTGKQAPHQILPDGTVIFVAADVPSMGYKTFSVVEEPEQADTPSLSPVDDEGGDRVLENQFYRVEFDPTTAAIASIRDKQIDVELVDQTAPNKFNEYLYERSETPDPKTPTKWYRVESARMQVARGPAADVVTVKAAPVGVESLQQTVILYHDLKRIDFTLDMVKSPSGSDCDVPRSSALNKESLYVALPFAVPEGRFHHELPGAVVQPICDQFDGSCTAFYAVRHFADVSNDRYGATVASVDAPLVEYGRPRSCLITGGRWGDFEKTMEYPNSSRMYLYLLNNMFDTNVRWDQAGPMSFSYSIRSHESDWRSSEADAFGRAIHCPLMAQIVTGKQQGSLPIASSFLAIDRPNIVCTTLKPAEFNGTGLILRFVESRGLPTDATVSLPLFGRIESAVETDLVENDRPASLEVSDGSRIAFSMRPFGVKTIRVVFGPRDGLIAVSRFKAEPISDMETALTWQATDTTAKDISHFNVYRDRQPDFKPSLLNLVARPVVSAYTDRPQLYYGGWINNRLEPETTYYYKVSAVDRWNNEGPRTDSVAVKTLKSTEKNMTPLQVACLRAIHVSPVAPHSYVNLLFRTNCESDIASYEIHRSTRSGFTPDDSNQIGVVEAEAIIEGSKEYGRTPVDYRVREFDHAMYQDDAAEPGVVYYYKVSAVDRAGQNGPYSDEASIRINQPVPSTTTATSTHQ